MRGLLRNWLATLIKTKNTKAIDTASKRTYAHVKDIHIKWVVDEVEMERNGMFFAFFFFWW